MGVVIRVPRFCGAQHRGERHAALDQPCCDALLMPRQSVGLSGLCSVMAPVAVAPSPAPLL